MMTAALSLCGRSSCIVAVFSVLVSEAGRVGSRRAGGRDALPGLDLTVCSYDKLVHWAFVCFLR